jgi:hypothetical protein
VHEALSFRIDGVEAEYLGQGERGPSSSHWKVADAIGSAPKFAFELGETQALGTVRAVILKFYPKRKGDYVARPAPTIVSAAPDNPDLQMKSGVTYDLGALGTDFKVMDALGRAARRFGLRPGFDYKMEVIFEGRRSHIAVIFMKVAE